MRTLHNHVGIEKERYASPLNVETNTRLYWSAYKRDEVFGAGWDTHSVRWEGSSEANPEYEHKDMHKALRHAIHSCILDPSTPTFTLMVLPAWDEKSNTSYNALLRSNSCAKVLMRIPRKHFKFAKPTSWQDNEEFAGNPKWDVNLIMVANEAGYDTYCSHLSGDPRKREAFFADLIQALREVSDEPILLKEIYRKWMPCRGNLDWRPDDARARKAYRTKYNRCPEKLRQAPRDTTAEPPGTRTLLQKHLTDWREHLNERGARARAHLSEIGQRGRLRLLLREDWPTRFAAMPLRHDWRKHTYTDGSYTAAHTSPGGTHIPAMIGAGAYIPDMGPGTEGKHIYVNTGPPGAASTIMRAELAAIYAVLDHSDNILTDSAAAIHLIRQAVDRPHLIADHLHGPLLLAIVEKIGQKPNITHIRKVKSHLGIVGNEMADICANKAARGESNTPAVTVGSEPFKDRHWPATCKTLADQTTTYSPLPNIKQALKKSCRIYRLGNADLAGIYASSWAAIAPETDGVISNTFLTHTSVDPLARRDTLRYRSGGLDTNKWRYMCKLSNTLICPNCHEPDGGHHALSGCKK